MKEWLEHFILLPLKWMRIHCKVWFVGQQRCKVCGCRDKFNFDVKDDVWKQVVPKQYQSRVVCMACFDDFAKKKGVDYTTAINSLYFAGSKTAFRLSICTDEGELK